MRRFARKGNGTLFQDDEGTPPPESDATTKYSQQDGGDFVFSKPPEVGGSAAVVGTTTSSSSSSSVATSGGGGGMRSPGKVVGSSNGKTLKIGRNVRFRGDVMECESVVLCGRLEGFLEARRVIIREGASFVGDAKVEEAEIYGRLKGSLESTVKVSLRSTGSISGSVVYNRMTMEDGAELDGTYECKGKKSPRQSSGGGGGGSSSSADQRQPLSISRGNAARALAAAGVGVAGGEDVGSLSAAAALAGEASPTRSREEAIARGDRGSPAGIPSAVSTPATGRASDASWWYGSNPKPTATTPASADTTSHSDDKYSFPSADNILGGVGALTPVSRGDVGQRSSSARSFGTGSTGVGALSWRVSPRRSETSLATTVPGSSPAKAIGVMPETGGAKSHGSSVSNPGASGAAEQVGSEAEVPGTLTKIFGSQSVATPQRTSTAIAAAAAREKNVSTNDIILSAGSSRSSVATKISTWPPPVSPSKTPSSAAKQAEEVTPTSSSSVAPAAGGAGGAGEARAGPAPTFRLSYWEAANAGVVAQSVSGGVGVGVASSGGGASALEKVGVDGVAKDGDGGGGKSDAGAGAGGGDEVEDDTPSVEEEGTQGPMKACEGRGCKLEACWGDPRFRPRYCVTHKRAGHKLMDPVEQEEGDEAAESDRGSGPIESDTSQTGAPDTRVRTEAASASAGDSEPDGDSRTGADDISSDRSIVKDTSTNGSIAPGKRTTGSALQALQARQRHHAAKLQLQQSVAAQSPVAQSPAISGGSGAGLGRLAGAGGEDMATPTTKYDVGDAGDSGDAGGSSSNGELEEDELGENHEGEVLARVATFERLSKKPTPTTPSQQTPSHTPTQSMSKSCKRPSGAGTCIADFYGAESESDEEETSFNMDSYNKGVMLSQAAEVGTHTEDGQLRPQASEQRDQQRLAHLVRVGKLGAAVRGRGLSAGKRR